MNVDTFNRLVFLMAFGLVAWRCIIAVQYFVSCDLPGAPGQGQSSGIFTINEGVTLTISGTATNVGVLIQEWTGFGWTTACVRSYAQATSVVIIVSGTTFFPACTGG